MRVVTEGYDFQEVEGTVLPFADDSFDIVISNHTIEHVGSRDDQLVHLREIARTMRSDAVGYLASPSRWALVEPHFKVPMLSWFPVASRDRVLRLARRGTVYDINPRTRPELRGLIDEAGLRGEDITLDALQTAADIEGGRGAKVAARMPAAALGAARGAIPTMVFLLTHR
jgi:SAM-dependent methyltransferase